MGIMGIKYSGIYFTDELEIFNFFLPNRSIAGDRMCSVDLHNLLCRFFIIHQNELLIDLDRILFSVLHDLLLLDRSGLFFSSGKHQRPRTSNIYKSIRLKNTKNTTECSGRSYIGVF